MGDLFPFGRGSLPWLGGGFNCYESFSGHPAPEKGQKNLKPPAALRGRPPAAHEQHVQEIWLHLPDVAPETRNCAALH